MKVKLWQVKSKHRNPSYWGENNEVTINARTIDEALKKANKWLPKGHAILEIEWLATED